MFETKPTKDLLRDTTNQEQRNKIWSEISLKKN